MLKILLDSLQQPSRFAWLSALFVSFFSSAIVVNAQPELMPEIDTETNTTAAATAYRTDPSADHIQPSQGTSKAFSDPLNSPYPVPWTWVMSTQAEAHEQRHVGLRYYRSPVLLSPDNRYAVYSRVQMKAATNLSRSQVVSVIFVEDLQTGSLKSISATSPFEAIENHPQAQFPGMISILVPISWSQDSSQLLSRQFEGIFSTSDATDFAVVWDSETNEIYTVAPEQDSLTTSILLGWHPANDQEILFRAGVLGEEYWPMWAVALDGKTVLADTERPQLYGQQVMKLWSGPQSLQ